MNQAQHKAIAIHYLQATRTSRGDRYRAHETSSDWVVSARDLVRLGRMIAAEDLAEIEGRSLGRDPSAYDRWCAVTNAVEVSR